MKRNFYICFLISLFLPFNFYAQDIEAILAIQEIDTMLYSGPKDNRINWVIQNRGDSFDDKDDFTTLYRNDLLKTFEVGHPLEQVPYAHYRNFFNLYSFWWPDAPDDNNGWSFQIIKGLRDLVFLPWANDETGWATFFSSTKYGGGGGAGLERDRRVGDGKMYGMGWETFLHEFGHTMPGLLDEYSADGSWSNSQCWETPNTTGQLNIDDIPWRLWIKEGTPIPTPYTEEYLDRIGAFEGAMTNYFGCHRPTARGCFMGAGGFGEDYGQELCSPCKQRVICFLYRYVNVIENPRPAEEELSVTGTQTITFSADVIAPEPNTQVYQWILNGKVIATGVTEVAVTFEACDAYELVFSVTDTNSLVRYDPKFDATYPKPYREQVWTINATDVDSYALASLENVLPADCTGDANGYVLFEISGGLPPYRVFHDGKEIQNPIHNLAPGQYFFDIIDAKGCSIQKEIIIGEEKRLDPVICSQYDGSAWTLFVEVENYGVEDLQFLWSNGATSPSVSGLVDGTYSVEVQTLTGCGKSMTISLSGVNQNIVGVNSKTFPTELNQATGRIYLDIKNGRPLYSIEWKEKLNHDLSTPEPDNILSSGTTWDHLPEYAFDDDRFTKWLHAISNDAFIGYRFEEPVLINYYRIQSANDVPERDPKNWKFQGSSDGANWITLDQQMNHQFDSRYEWRGFVFENPIPYSYYRLFIEENYGDIATQIQELELIGTLPSDSFIESQNTKDKTSRFDLGAGVYAYSVKDQNGIAQTDTLDVGYIERFVATDLVVIRDGNCGVRIESPNPGIDYYWFGDKDASEILGVGNSFSPVKSANFYVAAVDQSTRAMSSNLRGFAVTVEAKPEIFALNDTTFVIENPNPELDYYWYDQATCGIPIHEGTTFTPFTDGYYYVATHRPDPGITPIDPSSIPGVIIRMDAADLNGDGMMDDPPPVTSSLYDWQFTNGNHWAFNNWFAYRGNQQNGLGIVDFATIWLQRIEQAESNYQTILLAYKENPISFSLKAPFEGLSQNIPRHLDASQLYSSAAPDRTLNGSTYLNGKMVNPLITPNPMHFCILGTAMTESSNAEVFYTDTHWEGQIGELILYDRALSAEEMKGASEFLRKKWISSADLESPRNEIYWESVTTNIEEEGPGKSPIQLYPNPTSDQVTVSGLKSPSEVQILTINGNVLNSMHTIEETVQLDVHSLLNGAFLIRIQSDQVVHVYRMIKL